MADNKKNEDQQKGLSSNPEKSFDAGKKGGKEATRVSNQMSDVNDSDTGARNSLGGTYSRVDPQNKPTQGQSSARTETDETGRKDKPET